MKAYMTSWMASCVTICWPPNGQWVKCMLDASNSCPHSLVKRLNVNVKSNLNKNTTSRWN
jgi:hypothetical protein